MTIFLEIVHILVLPKIEELSTYSQRADESYFNTLRISLQCGRNIDVSKQKRTALVSFQEKLQNLSTAAQVNDRCMIETIKQYIVQCVVDLETARRVDDTY